MPSMNALEQELEEVNTRFIGYWKSGDKKNIESVYSDKIRLCTEFRNFMSGKGGAIIQAKWAKDDIGMARLELDTKRHFRCAVISDTTAIQEGAWNCYKADGSYYFSFYDMVVWKKIDGKWLVHRGSFCRVPRGEV